MKIAEIVGSLVVQPRDPVPFSGFAQRIANAFPKRSGEATVRFSSARIAIDAHARSVLVYGCRR